MAWGVGRALARHTVIRVSSQCNLFEGDVPRVLKASSARSTSTLPLDRPALLDLVRSRIKGVFVATCRTGTIGGGADPGVLAT